MNNVLMALTNTAEAAASFLLMSRLLLPSEIEFNLTGSYGSPIHTNHNSNYSSMPSPDVDQSERKQPHDQSRRPLSVATDNMMLEFYKKDGYGAKRSILLPTSHSHTLSFSPVPPTPPLTHLILNSCVWKSSSLHIKYPSPPRSIYRSRSSTFFPQKSLRVTGIDGSVGLSDWCRVLLENINKHSAVTLVPLHFHVAHLSWCWWLCGNKSLTEHV